MIKIYNIGADVDINPYNFMEMKKVRGEAL